MGCRGHPIPMPRSPGEGGPGHPSPAPVRLSASETGEDVSFWWMPPLILNNAPDGPARTSLVRDVVRSELVPRREAERGDGDPHAAGTRRESSSG